jgi:heat shock protein HtpX
MKPPLAMVLPRLDAINAFAAGGSEDDAVVAVTRGALDKLTRDELQGLVAHEFSHLREGDTRLNMRLAGMVFGLEMIFNLGAACAAPTRTASAPFLALPGLAILVTGSLGWLAGRALKAASRQREFLADARACSSRAAGTAWAACCARWPGRRAGHGARAQPASGGAAHAAGRCPRPYRWFASHPPLCRAHLPDLRPAHGGTVRCGTNCRRGPTPSFECPQCHANDELVPSTSPMVRMPGVTRRTEVLDTPYRVPRAPR